MQAHACVELGRAAADVTPPDHGRPEGGPRPFPPLDVRSGPTSIRAPGAGAPGPPEKTKGPVRGPRPFPPAGATPAASMTVRQIRPEWNRRRT